ncbi:uncharacterized protein LOC133821700 [Humulus lupulus]|uniref:uncharacterized protein LOC133821700 n=1 Tax=Humulus lupulus TaxID=3486 RepID=UPI002B407CF4|nr:uncharacterized protein LOC133821700 [Humulus lupulus]
METKAYYDDFEPYCLWETKETYDILKIYLQGFQMEHIKIEKKPNGEIIISGERPYSYSGGSSNRIKRFSKDIRVSPKEYDLSELDVKFEGLYLCITMPKKAKANPIFVEQIISLKHRCRKAHSEIAKKSKAIKVLVAVSLGMALGVFLAFKYSKKYSYEETID